MDIVYFIYGLSFVLMAVSIVVTRGGSSIYALASNLLLLAAFGALHGLLEWTYLWKVVRGDTAWLAASRPWLMFASYLVLLEFGRRVMLDSCAAAGSALHRVLAPWVLHGAVGVCTGVAWLLHHQRPDDLDIAIRYFACMPASLLSGVALRQYFAVRLMRPGGLLGADTYGFGCKVLSGSLLGYGVLAGLVVPASDWGLPSLINQVQFNAWFGVPVQILRALCAVAMAWATVVLLKRFSEEGEHTLRMALDAAKAGSDALRAKQALQRKNQALAHEALAATTKSHAKTEFLASMSHEIRTPLGAISGMAQLIGREPLSPAQADKLQKLQVAANHLGATINDVLDLSKIEANMLVLEQVPVRMERLIGAVEAMVSDRLHHKGVDLQVHLEPMPSGLMGDPTRLTQALLNYLGNAEKFTAQGRIALRGSVVEDAPDSVLVKFEVQDTGPGIAPQALAKLFEPFVQAGQDTARKYGGSGLGLAITKRLAQAMGGEVGAHSTLGQGTTFWFTARLLKDSESSVPESDAVPLDAWPQRIAACAGKRVLLAEDDAFNREIGSVLLQDVGLLVDVAEDGLVALDMALAGHYDLILMDVQMPRMDGLEATRRIRASALGRSVPIVALTANAFNEDKQRCLQAGMDKFVTKPIDTPTLYRVIAPLLQGHHSAR